MKLKNKIFEILKNNKNCFKFCIIITFIFGLIAHGYMLLNNSISHDSLGEFISNRSVIIWKIQLGRVFWPFYQYFTRGLITLPWLIGLLSFLYIGISVFLITKIFNIKSKAIITLISGILTVNLTVISLTATYINDMDVDIFALLLSVLSVFIFKKYKFGYLFGMIPLMGVLGLYQSYISVTITLILIILIMDLLKKEKFKRVFICGMKAIAMIIGAGVLYFVAMKLVLTFFDVSIVSKNYNSIDTILYMSFGDILSTLKNTYFSTIRRILSPISSYPSKVVFVSSAVVIFLNLSTIFKRIFSKDIKIKEKILLVLLIILLPLGMNICEVLTNGMSHHLMHYSLWLTYLFIILLVCLDKSENYFSFNNIKKVICLVFVFVTIIGNIRLANTTYLLKNFDKDASLSFFTRVIDKIESYDNYVPGETKVAFIGNPKELFVDDARFKNIRGITGMINPFVVTSNKSYYDSYFKNVLKTPVNHVWNLNLKGIKKEIKQMPVYPKAGSIKMINDTLFVKFSEQ